MRGVFLCLLSISSGYIKNSFFGNCNMFSFIVYYKKIKVKEVDVKVNSKVKKLVVTALLTALTCVATMIIKIPSPFKGYLNLGDCIVLLAGWILSPVYGVIAAGLGSALADVFSGYAIYAPATFVIKGSMALIAFAFSLIAKKGLNKFLAQLIGGFLAEIFMVLGYYLFEGFMYGFIESAVNIAPNCVQGAVGLTIAIILIKILEKAKVIEKINEKK